MSRRKRNNNIINFILIILVVIMVVIIVFAVKDHIGKNNDIKETQTTEKQDTKNETKEEEKKDTPKKEENTNVNTPITEEEQNQKERKNRDTSDITLDIIGDDEITVSKGSSFVDPGFTATYSDGTDASSEISVDNTVDINNEGTYTITYSVGNQIIIRRVIVK